MVGITSNKIDKFKVVVESLITFRWSENWLRNFTVNCYPNRRRCQSQGGHCFFMAHISKIFTIDLRKREIWLRLFNQCRFHLFAFLYFISLFFFHSCFNRLIWTCVRYFFLFLGVHSRKKKNTPRCSYAVRMIFIQRCIATCWAVRAGAVVLFGFNTPMLIEFIKKRNRW